MIVAHVISTVQTTTNGRRHAVTVNVRTTVTKEAMLLLVTDIVTQVGLVCNIMYEIMCSFAKDRV